MATHQDKRGVVTLGGQRYQYRYTERDWNILGNTELENLMHTSLHGTVHEMVLLDVEPKVEFQDGRTLCICTVGAGSSFDACVKQLEKYFLLYEIAKTSSSLDEAKTRWYEKLEGLA